MTEKLSQAEAISPPADVPPARTNLHRLPLSLEFIAFLFLLHGALALTEMFLQLFVLHTGVFIDLSAFFTPFVGIGLLRRKESSRRGAVFFTWLFLILLPVVGLVAFGNLVFGTPQVRAEVYGLISGPLVIAIICSALVAYFLWQLRTLRRHDIVGLFQQADQERKSAGEAGRKASSSGSRQFSLTTVFFATALIAIVMLRISGDDVQYVDSIHEKTLKGANNRRGEFLYGIKSSRFFGRPDRLTYVVLSTGNQNISAGRRTTLTSDRYYVSTPDGVEISSVSPRQLYEVIDGRTHSREERITFEELHSFLDSSPSEWSLDALITHAEQLRIKRQTTNK